MNSWTVVNLALLALTLVALAIQMTMLSRVKRTTAVILTAVVVVLAALTVASSVVLVFNA